MMLNSAAASHFSYWLNCALRALRSGCSVRIALRYAFSTLVSSASGSASIFRLISFSGTSALSLCTPHSISRKLIPSAHALASLNAAAFDPTVFCPGNWAAPALAAADVGIAMGTGTDVAIESAGLTLLKGDLTGIVRARRLSRAVMGNIRQNLFFAFIYNAAGVPVAAGILYPFLGILLSPVIAAAAMALSSVSVIGNALRLRAARL